MLLLCDQASHDVDPLAAAKRDRRRTLGVAGVGERLLPDSGGTECSATPARVRQSQLDAFLSAGEAAPEPERLDDEGDDWRPVRTALEIVVAAVDGQDRAGLDTAMAELAAAGQSLRAT